MRVEKLTWCLPGFLFLSMHVFRARTCFLNSAWLSIPGTNGFRGVYIPKAGDIDAVHERINSICEPHLDYLSKPDFPCILLYALFKRAAKKSNAARECWDLKDVGCYRYRPYFISDETQKPECAGMKREGNRKDKGDKITLQKCLEIFTAETGKMTNSPPGSLSRSESMDQVKNHERVSPRSRGFSKAESKNGGRNLRRCNALTEEDFAHSLSQIDTKDGRKKLADKPADQASPPKSEATDQDSQYDDQFSKSYSRNQELQTEKKSPRKSKSKR